MFGCINTVYKVNLVGVNMNKMYLAYNIMIIIQRIAFRYVNLVSKVCMPDTAVSSQNR